VPKLFSRIKINVCQDQSRQSCLQTRHGAPENDTFLHPAGADLPVAGSIKKVESREKKQLKAEQKKSVKNEPNART
jgi:hypothetical protein